MLRTIEVDDLEKICNLTTVEDEPYSNPPIVAKEARSQATTNIGEKTTLAKMANLGAEIFGFCPTAGDFNLEDFISDDLWINDTICTVPNLGLLQPEPDCTAESVLEEIIPSSPTSSEGCLDGSSNDLDSSFLEHFIDLAAFEPCQNTLNTHAVSNFLPSVLNDFLEPFGQDVFQEISLDESIVDVEGVSETDSVALVPDVLEETYLMHLDDGLVENPVFAVDENHLVLNPLSSLSDSVVVDPTASLLLEEFENSITIEDKVIPTSRKRSSAEENSTSTTGKKSRISKPSCSLSPEDALPTCQNDKVIKRRMKNNEASRACRANRKARKKDLFEREKELVSENKELTVRVDELSSIVNHLRNYLVQKLSEKSA